MGAVDIISFFSLILALTGNFFINVKKRAGYIIWVVGNAGWIVAILLNETPNYYQIVMYVIFSVLNIHGFINWKRMEKQGKDK